MKIFRISLRVLLLLAASAAIGQTTGSVVADVPFSFVVAGRQFPAGHYTVRAASDLCLWVSDSQHRGTYVPIHDSFRSTSEGTKLVFHRYGDTYFLSAVWVSGRMIGRELYPSRAEKEAANHRAEMELAVVRPGKLDSTK